MVANWSNSTGQGWGGPASGGPGKARTDGLMKPAPRFQVGNQMSKGNLSHRAPSAIEQRERNQRLKNHLFHLALNGESEVTQVRASEAYLNRTEGMPIQRNVNVNVDSLGTMSDDELEARVIALEQELSSDTQIEGHVE